MTDFTTEPLATRAKVFAAAEQLIADSKKPTMVAVKNLLGGGSFSTISPLLAEWKEEKRQTHAVIKTPVPDSVSKALGAVSEQIWGIAQEEAEKSIAGEREALHTASQELSDREADLLDAIRSNESEISALTDKLDRASETAAYVAGETEKTFSYLNTSVEDLKLERARLQEHSKNLEAIALERKELLTASTNQVEKIQEKLEKANSERESAQKKAQEIGYELKSKTDESQRLSSSLDGLKKEYGNIKTELQTALKIGSDTTSELKAEQQKTAQALEKINGLDQLLAQIKGQLDNERERSSGLQKEAVDAAKAKAAAESEAAELRGKLAQITEIKAK